MVEILMVSTRQFEQVDKFNWLNKIISIKLDNCFVPQIKNKLKKKENFQFLLKTITNTTLFLLEWLKFYHIEQKNISSESENLKLDVYIK